MTKCSACLIAIAVALVGCTHDAAPVLEAGSDGPCAPNADETSCEATPSCDWVEADSSGICYENTGTWPGSGGATCTCADDELCVMQAGMPIACKAGSSCGSLDPGFCDEQGGVNNLCYCTTI